MEDSEKKNRVYHTKATEDVTEANAFTSTFGSVIAKDSGDKTFGFSERILAMECIDMDLWEKSLSGDADKTMDCAIGISAFDDTTRRHSSHRILLVELKMNCTSRKATISSGELSGKVRHSKEMLIKHTLDKHMIFLFPETQRSLYARELSRWQRGTDKSIYQNWKVLSPSQFNNYIGFKEDYPYKPIYSEVSISQSLLVPSAKNNYDGLLIELEGWKDKLNECMVRYQSEEVKHIRSVISKTMETILPSMPNGEDKELIKMEYQNIFDFSTHN